MISLILTVYFYAILIFFTISLLGSGLLALCAFVENFINKEKISQKHEELENEVQMLNYLLTSSKFELGQLKMKSLVIFEFKNIESKFLREQNQKLESDLQNLQEQLMFANVDKAKSHVLFEFKNIESKFLREQNHKLESELQNLQVQLAFANTDRVELREQVEFITIESDVLSEESRKNESELQSLKEQLAFANMELAKLRELKDIETGNLREQIAELEAELERPQDQFNYGLYTIPELDESCELEAFTNGEFNLLCEQNHMLVSELQTLQGQLAFANTDLAELHEQVEFLTIESNVVPQENRMEVSELQILQDRYPFANMDLAELLELAEFITIESNIVREENRKKAESELQSPKTASVDEETTPERELPTANATMQDMCDYFLSLHCNSMMSLRRRCLESVHSLHHENVP